MKGPYVSAPPLAHDVPFLLTLFALAVAIVAWVVVWRRYRVKRYHLGVSRRIRDRFPALDEPLSDGVPLHSPPGEVAVRSDGIHLHLETEDFGHCRVPWSDIHHVLPTGRGGVRVHISGVGDVSVPGSAGRQIWAAMNDARSGRHVGA